MYCKALARVIRANLQMYELTSVNVLNEIADDILSDLVTNSQDEQNFDNLLDGVQNSNQNDRLE